MFGKISQYEAVRFQHPAGRFCSVPGNKIKVKSQRWNKIIHLIGLCFQIRMEGDSMLNWSCYGFIQAFRILSRQFGYNVMPLVLRLLSL